MPAWVERALVPPEPEFALRRLEQHFTYDLLPTENISPSLWLTYTMWRAGLQAAVERAWARAPVGPRGRAPGGRAAGAREAARDAREECAELVEIRATGAAPAVGLCRGA